MATQKVIIINKYTDLHEYIDFFKNGIAYPVVGWAFKLKLVGTDGTVYADIAGTIDLEITNRAWFNKNQVDLANVPLTNVLWYLLAKDLDGYIRALNKGIVTVLDGPAWV